MDPSAAQILRTYVTLTSLSTLAASLIWGINTLFLLDAGLSITEAFAANAFFTAGEVLFEVPTGVVADAIGRRASYLLGSATLFASTALYLLCWQTHAPFWAWAAVSMLLGLGFTFFSGATEAWLVDGLNAARYQGTLESAFARGQIAGGIAMLAGAVAGGVLAQATNLGAPYLVRAALLGLTFLVAFRSMRDVGFTPKRGVSIPQRVRGILRASFEHGLRNPPVRWVMLAEIPTAGVSIYAFYAMQPYLLELYGRSDSYSIAGLAAAVVAGMQILGGLVAPRARRFFEVRTSLLIFGSVVGAGAIALTGLVRSFWGALILFAIWAFAFAMRSPVRQAYINGLIPSDQRATVLSSDSLLGSSGGVLLQPALGGAADLWGYSASYLIGAGFELLASPFLLLARREKAASDPMPGSDGEDRGAATRAATSG